MNKQVGPFARSPRFRRLIAIFVCLLMALTAPAAVCARSLQGGTPPPGGIPNGDPNQTDHCRKTSDNGIVVGQTKVFDENSLRVMLQGTEESLQRIQAVNPTAVASAVPNIQGQRESDTALAVSATTLPGVILGRQNKPPESETTAPTVPAPPAQLPNSLGQLTFGLSAEDLLAEQMSLSAQVINLRMLLERSLTDRIIDRPIRSSSLFRASDVRDPAGLTVKLRDAKDLLSRHLQAQLPAATREKLAAHAGSDPPSEELYRGLVEGLNQVLKGPSLYDEYRFAQVALTDESRLLAAQQLQGLDLLRLNRQLLEEAYPEELVYSSATAFNLRAQTVVGFQISIDPKSRYKNAVAEVEITVVSPRTLEEAPSLISLIPKDKTYNVGTVTKKSKVFNAGAVIQLLSLGGSYSSSKADTFLVRDTDTVGLERAAPHVEAKTGTCQPAPHSLTFGWQFRPVLDRRAVDPGTRQVFAMLSLPLENHFGNVFDGKVMVHTHWRRYDGKTGTVGEIIPGSSDYRELKNLLTRAGGFSAHILGPRVDSVKWSPADNGQVLVQVEGVNFLPGTRITFGDKVLDGPASGLTIQNDTLMIFKVPGELLALHDNPLVIGRYGPAVALRNRLRASPDGSGPKILDAQSKFVETVDSQTSLVTLLVRERRQVEGESYNTDVPRFVYQPVVIVGNKVFGMPGGLRVKRTEAAPAPEEGEGGGLAAGRSVAAAPPPEGMADVTLELSFRAPTALLRDAGKIVTVKDVFYGDEFSKDVALNLGGDDFTASDLIVLSASKDKATFAVRGTNFDKTKIVTVVVGGEEFSTGKKDLKVHSSTLLTFNTKPEVVAGVKNILVNQRVKADEDGVTVVLALPTPPALPRPVIEKAEPPAVEGHAVTLTLKGANLGSIAAGQFEGADLKPKPSDDGKSMTIELPSALVSKAGRKDLRFTLKNGEPFVYTLTVEKAP